MQFARLPSSAVHNSCILLLHANSRTLSSTIVCNSGAVPPSIARVHPKIISKKRNTHSILRSQKSQKKKENARGGVNVKQIEKARAKTNKKTKSEEALYNCTINSFYARAITGIIVG